MLKYLFAFIGVGLIACSNPVGNNKNYYNDLSKGTAKTLTSNENDIIDALIKYRVSDSTDEIVLISDSTIFFPLDATHIVPKDTFPVSLITMLQHINDKKYYIGNTLLTISNDYRYLPRNYLNGHISLDNYWNEFYELFPKSKHGLLSFSKIAINQDSTMAIAFVWCSYNFVKADGGVMSFKKENGIWKVIKYLILLV